MQTMAINSLIGLAQDIDVALQGQLVGQVNLSGQFGASVATAVSDDVTVNQFGTINAWDGDGIAAASQAEAVAAVVQTGSQSNTNSAGATFEAGQIQLDGSQFHSMVSISRCKVSSLGNSISALKLAWRSQPRFPIR